MKPPPPPPVRSNALRRSLRAFKKPDTHNQQQPSSFCGTRIFLTTKILTESITFKKYLPRARRMLQRRTTKPKSLHPPIVRAFKPVLIMLTVTGVDIETSFTPLVGRTQKCLLLSKGPVMMVYKLILLAAGLLHFAANIYGLYKAIVSMMTSTRVSFMPLFYNDPFVAFLILVFHTFFNGTSITPFLLRLTQWLQILDRYNESFYKIRRWAWTLAVLCAIAFALHITNLIATLQTWEPITFKTNYGNFYFGMPNSGPNLEKVLGISFALMYAMLTTCTYLYSSLIILLCLSMHYCFKTFNDRLQSKRNLSYDHIEIYQHQHQRLAALVDSFNTLFSPILLIMVTRCIIQTVAGYDEIKIIMKYGILRGVDIIRRAFLTFVVYAAALGFVIGMTFSCGNLFNEVKLSFEITSCDL